MAETDALDLLLVHHTQWFMIFLMKASLLCCSACGHTGAHELGHVAGGAAGLLRPLPDQADEV